MNSILVALAAAAAAATLAYAHGIDGARSSPSAGTLTCRTNPDLGLVLGRARGASCQFVAADGQRQSYAAILPPGMEGEGARILTWRVRTAEGRARPGLLDDRFTLDGPVLRGERADLIPIDLPSETGLRLASDDARVAVSAR